MTFQSCLSSKVHFSNIPSNNGDNAKIERKQNTMTTRRMSPKGFLHKSNGKAAVSAAAFIAAHKEYLTTGEVSYLTKPLVEKLEAGQSLPTPTLMEIKNAVLAHIMEVDKIKALESFEKAGQPKESKSNKPYSAIIRDGSGAIVDDDEGKPMRAFFDLPQRASDWCDRRLFSGMTEWFGEVLHIGTHYDFVERDDSIARILKRPMGSVCKRQKKSTNRLGFGVKAKESAIRFRRG